MKSPKRLKYYILHPDKYKIKKIGNDYSITKLSAKGVKEYTIIYGARGGKKYTLQWR